jgi:hypothetical protein
MQKNREDVAFRNVESVPKVHYYNSSLVFNSFWVYTEVLSPDTVSLWKFNNIWSKLLPLLLPSRLHWRRRQQFPPKRWWPPTRIHVVTTLKNFKHVCQLFLMGVKLVNPPNEIHRLKASGRMWKWQEGEENYTSTTKNFTTCASLITVESYYKKQSVRSG